MVKDNPTLSEAIIKENERSLKILTEKWITSLNERRRLNKLIDAMMNWMQDDCIRCPFYNGSNCNDRHDPRYCDDAIKAYFEEKKNVKG